MAKTFEQYLRENNARGVIDFSLRKHIDHDGKITFYIHPALVSGDTADFIVEGNLLTPLRYQALNKPACPFDTFQKPYCKGSYALSSACGTCERCEWERNQRGL